ncbi:MAG: SDR family NAD(P)-dependent oxidoreductase [Deltaproteobacteria bacterium]|nr:SDR family NAD(P)-dependent oxidoreductase [Deltaproteobacteria bacterium]
MSNMFEGNVCIITGSSSGIGLGLAKELLRRGAVVYMSGWRETNQENLQITAELIAKYPQKAFSQELNVGDEKAVSEYIAGIDAKGPIDYMFSNAGVAMQMPFTSVDLTTWEKILSVDLYGVVYCVQTVVSVMLKQGHGHIINTASVAGIVPLPYQTVYCAAKYAIVGFSESLRYELEPYNIKVTVVCPGAVTTQIFQRDIDYKVHEELPAPKEAITIDQAALEILEGVEEGRGILPITDFARAMYENIRTDPAQNDAVMRMMAEQRRQQFIAQGLLDH